MANPPAKLCNFCLEKKPLTDFHVKTSATDGRQTECKVCRRTKTRKYASLNSDQRKKYYYEVWKKNNPNYYSEYYHKNRLVKNRYSAWYGSIRRANKLNATPSWLSSSQLEEIKDLYWLAKDLKAVTGEPYHVDHIVPLKGVDICGLHVPWNLQILPADLNISKGNRLDF